MDTKMKQYIGQMTFALTYEYHHIFAQKHLNPESFISIFNEMCKFENRLFRCTTSFREELVPYKYDEKWNNFNIGPSVKNTEEGVF